MNSEQIINSWSWLFSLSVIFKNSIESFICLLIIVLNFLLIISLVQVKHCRTSQNLLLVNVGFACIYFSISCLLSLSLTSYFLSTKTISTTQCRFIGFLLVSSCHCLMFSYTSVTWVRFLSILFPFKRKLTARPSIRLCLIATWTLAFILSSMSLILPNQHIRFQMKAKICFLNQQSPVMYIYFVTGYIIPILLISLMNLITYLSVKRSEQITSLSKSKLSRLNKRKRRNLRLLRQFSLFTIIFIFGWTPFIVVEIVDKDEKLSDMIYLYILILPPLCVLIDSCVIFRWNRTVRHHFGLWWQRTLTRTRKYSSERDKSINDPDMNSMITTNEF